MSFLNDATDKNTITTGEKSTVQVAVRVRPFNDREIEKNATANIINTLNQSVFIINPNDKTKKTFTFDYTYDMKAQQSDLYNDIGKNVVDAAYKGYNCCIFAYGQTGSGKSHTMMGSNDDIGLIPQICKALFDQQATHNNSPLTNCEIAYKVEFSYMEIYAEEVRDLMSSTNPVGGLRIRHHVEYGPYVEDLRHIPVIDYSTIKECIDDGNKERKTAATLMNIQSSRSHAIITLYFTQIIQDFNLGKTREIASRINLVDLAGSERVNDSGVTGVNFKEAITINKSLSALGLVIQSLADAVVKNVPKPKPILRATRVTTSGLPGPTGVYSYNTIRGRPRITPSGSASNSRSNSPTNAPNHTPTNAPSQTPTHPIHTDTQQSNSNQFTHEHSHIPFRNSVLTYILKESLGGNSKTFMIATLSPSALNYTETLNTLRYASNAKRIVNTVKINEDPNDKIINVLKNEIEQLRNQLKVKGSLTGTSSLELTQIRDEITQREHLMKEREKSWEQKMNEYKGQLIKTQQEFEQKQNETVQDFERRKLELEQKQNETVQDFERRKLELEHHKQELDRKQSETVQAFERKQSEFEKERIVETAISLQEHYEQKITALKKFYEDVEIEKLKQANLLLTEAVEKNQRDIQTQTKKYNADRSILSKQIQQLQSKIQTLENDKKSPTNHNTSNSNTNQPTNQPTNQATNQPEYKELAEKLAIIKAALADHVEKTKQLLKNPTIDDMLKIKDGFDTIYNLL